MGARGRLARLRYERGLTQEELAQALGVSRRYIYAIESGPANLYATRLFEALRELGAHIEVVPNETGQPGPAAGAVDQGGER